jgi:hypothetical protein
MVAENYYYLVSSLPALKLGERPVIDSTEFLEQAAAELDPVLFASLEKVALVPQESDCGSAAVENEWNAWETYLRNILLRHRTESGDKIHRWAREERDVFPGVRRHVEEALNQPNPLQRERELDELRWMTLEGLRVTHEFDFSALIIYRLQLLLAEKWAAQDAEQGMASLNRMVEKLEKQAREKRNS